MKRLSLFALAALFAVAPSAQNRTTTDMDRDDRMSMDDDARYRADLDRLDRDLRDLRRTADPAMRSDLDRLQTDYEELRTAADGDAISDPAAVARSRMDRDQRYADLDRRVYQARLRSARNRNDFVSAANDRVDRYDRQIDDVRMRYQSADADTRGDIARDLIQLRRDRDAYRDEVYDTRGMLRSDFEGGRDAATSRLDRYDTTFTSTYRDASMRMMDDGMSQPDRTSDM